MLSKNQITTYLLYAIGEIFLVVIGILIAVSIDDWNQRAENEQKTLTTFRNIASDLKNEIAFLEEMTADLTWKDEYMTSIQNGDFTKEEWITNDSIFDSFIGYGDFIVDNDNITLLKSQNPESVASQELATELVSFYKLFSTEIAVRKREVDDATYNNLNYWRDNMDWYSVALIERDFSDLADHAIGNPKFRNRLIHKRIMQLRYNRKLQEYAQEAEDLIVKIAELTGE